MCVYVKLPKLSPFEAASHSNRRWPMSLSPACGHRSSIRDGASARSGAACDLPLMRCTVKMRLLRT